MNDPNKLFARYKVVEDVNEDTCEPDFLIEDKGFGLILATFRLKCHAEKFCKYLNQEEFNVIPEPYGTQLFESLEKYGRYPPPKREKNE